MLHPIMMRPAQSFWGFYCKQLDRRPLLSRCMTGVVGAIAGDVVAQSAERAVRRATVQKHNGDYQRYLVDVPEHDVWRTMRLVLWGFVVGTPLSYRWMQLLDSRIMVHNPRSPAAVLLKVLMDQLIMAPIGTCLFMFGINLLEGHPERFVQAVQTKFVPTMTANYMLWPLAHTINFALVPASQRILYMNVVGVLWTAVLSHLVMSDEHGEQHGGQAAPPAGPLDLKLKA